MDTNISLNAGCDLIQKLKTLKGAINYDGDHSTQVVFILTNGETLRFAVNSEGGKGGTMMVDQYRGLAIVNKTKTTDLGLPYENIQR